MFVNILLRYLLQRASDAEESFNRQNKAIFVLCVIKISMIKCNGYKYLKNSYIEIKCTLKRVGRAQRSTKHDISKQIL